MITVTINTSYIGPRNAKRGIYVLTIKITGTTRRWSPKNPTKFNANISITGTKFAAPPTERMTHCTLDISVVVFGYAYPHNPYRTLKDIMSNGA